MNIKAEKKAPGAKKVATPLLGILLSTFMLQSCTSLSSADDTLAVGADDASAQASADGSYPDFSRPLTAAMAQMSDEEASQMSVELEALNAGKRAGTITEAQYWARVRELQKLAASHSATTVGAIENAQ